MPYSHHQIHKAKEKQATTKDGKRTWASQIQHFQEPVSSNSPVTVK